MAWIGKAVRASLRWLFGLALVVVGGSILLYVVGAVAGAPPVHAVNSYGGSAINFTVGSSQPRQYFQGPIPPTLSLVEARCQAWHQENAGICPDDPTLAAAYWPELQQEPQTLYLGMPPTCITDRAHLNIEYAGDELLLHCHTTAVWVNTTQRTMGVSAFQPTQLVIIPTSGMVGGRSLTVVEEDRAERWLSDVVSFTTLGEVALPFRNPS